MPTCEPTLVGNFANESASFTSLASILIGVPGHFDKSPADSSRIKMGATVVRCKPTTSISYYSVTDY